MAATPYILNQDGSNMNLLIDGDIGDFWGVVLKDLIKQIQYSNATNINVQISSGGGSVADGLAIASYLNGLNKNVTTSGFGLVASIATTILLAGKKVSMSNGSFFMIHNPTAGLYGDSTELRHTAETLDKITGELADIYVNAIQKNGKLIDGDAEKTKTKVLKMMEAETWLTAKEAMDFGFIDEVTQGVNFLNKSNAASILNSCKDFKNAPIEFLNNVQKIINMEVVKEVDNASIWESIKSFFKSNTKEIKALIVEAQTDIDTDNANAIEAAKELAKKHGFFKEEAVEVVTVTEPVVVEDKSEIEALQAKIKALEEKNGSPLSGADSNTDVDNSKRTRDKIIAPTEYHKEAVNSFTSIFKNGR